MDGFATHIKESFRKEGFTTHTKEGFTTQFKEGFTAQFKEGFITQLKEGFATQTVGTYSYIGASKGHTDTSSLFGVRRGDTRPETLE